VIDSFILEAARGSIRLAKHRKAEKIEVKDAAWFLGECQGFISALVKKGFRTPVLPLLFLDIKCGYRRAESDVSRRKDVWYDRTGLRRACARTDTSPSRRKEAGEGGRAESSEACCRYECVCRGCWRYWGSREGWERS
jgi:hypothetical protein